MPPTDLAAKPPRKSRLGLWLLIGGTLTLAGVAVFTWPGLRTSMADSRSSLSPAKIDGERAFSYLKQICAIGPRPAGSAANTRQRDLVAKHFREQGGTVAEQPFSGVDPLSGRQVAMVNLIGSWSPEKTERVVLGVHYDTRPFPDEDPDPATHSIPFIGANDGASGVALLMEIAHHLKDSATPWGVDLVLFDGEELVYGGGQNQNGEYFLGSKAFAHAYDKSQRNRTKSTPHYEAGIVLDMVAGKNMVIGREPHSLDFAPKLVRDVWSVAKALKIAEFRDGVGRAVLDDHLPLNNAGIPAIDIIDFEYPAWHTSKDLPRKLLRFEPQSGRIGRDRVAQQAEGETLITPRAIRASDATPRARDVSLPGRTAPPSSRGDISPARPGRSRAPGRERRPPRPPPRQGGRARRVAPPEGTESGCGAERFPAESRRSW